METTPKKILVVDDDPMLLGLIEAILKRGNYEPYLAPDGLEGMRLFEEVEPHLVLLDVMMPNLDGWEVCRRIRTVSTTPIVMISARSSDSDIRRALQAGANDYLVKPVYPNQLLKTISAILG